MSGSQLGTYIRLFKVERHWDKDGASGGGRQSLRPSKSNVRGIQPAHSGPHSLFMNPWISAIKCPLWQWNWFFCLLYNHQSLFTDVLPIIMMYSTAWVVLVRACNNEYRNSIILSVASLWILLSCYTVKPVGLFPVSKQSTFWAAPALHAFHVPCCRINNKEANAGIPTSLCDSLSQ